MGFVFGLILSLLAVFLILLVLVQRGRGGGLAGALGGMGGSSAFGAKAGDMFTRITIVVVAIWIAVCLIVGSWAQNIDRNQLEDETGTAERRDPIVPLVDLPAVGGAKDAPNPGSQPAAQATPAPAGAPAAQTPAETGTARDGDADK
jgi:preprotein translocase subunit SecG